MYLQRQNWPLEKLGSDMPAPTPAPMPKPAEPMPVPAKALDRGELMAAVLRKLEKAA